MTKDQSIRYWGSFSDSYMQTIGYWKFRRKNKEDSKILRDNIRYKGIHKGKRCFILGNGPSLGHIDFQVLRDEYVFTVNELMRHENFLSLHSNYHFIADPLYFKLQPDKKEDQKLIQVIKQLDNAKNPPILFVPIEHRKKILEYGWAEQLQVSFFSSKLDFYKGFNQKPDFTRFVPNFQLVIHWAIYMAVYMGFHEIYLLGCDMTNVITDIASFMHMTNDQYYVYQMEEEEWGRTVERIQKDGLEFLLSGYNKIFELFRELYCWCERQEVSLINCSAETILESIPRKNFEDIIK